MSEFSVGDLVESKHFRGVGAVLEGPNRKGEYLIGVGLLSIWFKPDQFIPSKQSADATKKSGKKIKRAKSSPSTDGQTLTLDLHGYTAARAIESVEQALDKAMLSETSALKLIHGLGSGTLQRALDKYLKDSPYVASHRIDERNPGVTWVYLGR